MTTNLDITAETALANFYKNSYFGDEAFHKPWVSLKIGPLSIPMPNPQSRREAIHLHDLTHLITGYDTSFAGEGEVAAYEIVTGFPPKYRIGWCYSPIALVVGMIVAPRRVIAAWRRAQGKTNLYWLNIPWAELKTLPMSELRRRFGLRD